MNFRLPRVVWSYDLNQERGAEKPSNNIMMPVGAIGSPESRNKLGMLVMVSLQLSVDI